MSISQWYLEKNTGLFKWNKWSAFHTFVIVSFTLLTIRGLVALMRISEEPKNAEVTETATVVD